MNDIHRRQDEPAQAGVPCDTEPLMDGSRTANAMMPEMAPLLPPPDQLKVAREQEAGRTGPVFIWQNSAGPTVGKQLSTG